MTSRFAQVTASSEIIDEGRAECNMEYKRAESRSDPVGTTVWSRVSENARKLALIYACSADAQNPIISEEAVTWANRLVIHQARRMLYQAQNYVYESEFDHRCKRLGKWLRKFQDWVPYWRISRAFKWSEKDHQAVRVALLNQGVIEYQEDQTSGRPKKMYKFRRKEQSNGNPNS
jgi:hypothetical protein